MAGAKHGPNRFDSYVSIHESVMEQLRREGFVDDDTLAWSDMGNGIIELQGEIRCIGGITISVTKYLEVVDGDGASARVQTFKYSYNASLSKRGNILRYCAPHGDHNCFHHKHVFDPLGAEAERVEQIGGDDWPTLGAVIEELRDWYWANYDAITALS